MTHGTQTPIPTTLLLLLAVTGLTDRLTVAVTDAVWDGAAGAVRLALTVHNPGPGAVWLPADFVRLPEGGDAYAVMGPVPYLPRLLAAGATAGLAPAVSPLGGSSIQLLIGADLWEVSGLDAALPAGRLP